MHYDAMKEVRAKGAAFHQFSADEHQEVADGSTREETVKTRKELGNSGSRPLEKRKRDIENRCAPLYAKWKQLQTSGKVPPSEPKPTSRTPVSLLCIRAAVSKPSSPEPKQAVILSQATMTVYADTLLAQLEREVLKKQKQK
ncbi:hypothetical protein EDC04DRAFT_664284 [Pisolithus marmoratus]|nr:hypothetical protein EDC04DRAFT_664284 [Pisolithus marmoratus]